MAALPAFQGPSWGAWRALLKAIFARPLSEAESRCIAA